MLLAVSLRRRLEQDYNLTITEGYGTSDLGLLGYQCRYGSGLHIPEEFIIEITDPDTGKQLSPGEVGEVVVTSFNQNFPLIRYATGDLSSYTDEPCPCSRTSSRLVRILGRVGDTVKVRSVFVHPEQIDIVASRFPETSKCQLIVGRKGYRDEAILKVELKEKADKEKLIEGIKKEFQDICRVKVDRVDFVAPGVIPEEHKLIVDERTWE